MRLSKDTTKRILRFYLRIRIFTSSWLFKKWYKVSIETERWDKVKLLTMDEFSKEVNSYPYKYDSFGGLLDSSFPSNQPDYFFQELEKGRDCDDYARIWRLWAKHHGMKAEEFVFLDINKPFKTAHVVCIARDIHNKFWLFNYEYYGPFSSFDDVIEKMGESYTKGDFVYARYQHELEKTVY